VVSVRGARGSPIVDAERADGWLEGVSKWLGSGRAKALQRDEGAEQTLCRFLYRLLSVCCWKTSTWVKGGGDGSVKIEGYHGIKKKCKKDWQISLMLRIHSEAVS
jgi:hypothetical protein